eukprot:Nitzschia sp. Nitz4//scaffold307_size21646//4822//6397//NITZ4_008595-RA/size21646-processed-gene-0.17-mRNA-1//1//CDS//3329547130//1638//frame0
MVKLVKKAKGLMKRMSIKNGTLVPPEFEECEPSVDFRQAEPAEVPIVIVGAGIVGLVLALALDKHCGLKVDLYEQAEAFHDDVGAGMACYPNGLRVIRDISPDLLRQLREVGYSYDYRRWERHDGTEVAKADEKVLSFADDQVRAFGIRRWKLQKVLFEAVEAAGIRIHFNKRLVEIEHLDEAKMNLKFEDGTTRETNLLFAADGSKSIVRTLASRGKYKLNYTGTTCLMGISKVPQRENALYLPSSITSKCHGAFYPTSPIEQCFQLHFPTAESQAQESLGGWGGPALTIAREDCQTLAETLEKDGWDAKYIQPIRHVDKAIKVGYSTLDPPLESFVFGRVVLLGDAAHPPVPYLGQGAQQGLEDAGTIALLLRHLCTKDLGNGTHFSFRKLQIALHLYDSLRLVRTNDILESGKLTGIQQQKRAESRTYNRVREEQIRRDVFYNETNPSLLPAVNHDYSAAVLEALEEVASR